MSRTEEDNIFSWYKIIYVCRFPYIEKEWVYIERVEKIGKQLGQVLVWRPQSCCGGRRTGQQPSPLVFQGFEALGPSPSFVPWQLPVFTGSPVGCQVFIEWASWRFEDEKWRGRQQVGIKLSTQTSLFPSRIMPLANSQSTLVCPSKEHSTWWFQKFPNSLLKYRSKNLWYVPGHQKSFVPDILVILKYLCWRNQKVLRKIWETPYWDTL